MTISTFLGPNSWPTTFSTDAENPNNKGYCDKIAQSPIDLLDNNDEQVNSLFFSFLTHCGLLCSYIDIYWIFFVKPTFHFENTIKRCNNIGFYLNMKTNKIFEKTY